MVLDVTCSVFIMIIMRKSLTTAVRTARDVKIILKLLHCSLVLIRIFNERNNVVTKTENIVNFLHFIETLILPLVMKLTR